MDFTKSKKTKRIEIHTPVECGECIECWNDAPDETIETGECGECWFDQYPNECIETIECWYPM